MASFTAFALLRPELGQLGADIDLTAGLEGLAAVDLSPPVAPQPLATPQGVAVTSKLPIKPVSWSVTAYRMPSFADDYYQRIHITPHNLDLGNLVSTQSVPVYVWNAYLEPRTLSEIQGLDEGILLSGQASPPLLFKALQMHPWQLSITPEGQPTLDTYLRWRFDNGSLAALHITASRIIAWSFTPDWSDGITEQLAFSTDVLQSESLVEQRRALRLTPRREFQANIYAQGRERQLLDMMLFGWGSRIWALPIWPEVQSLASALPINTKRIPCSTAYLDFRNGGLAMLRGEDAFTYEVVEIKAVDADGLDLVRGIQKAWPVGSQLYPVRTAELLSPPELTRLNDQVQGAQVHFRVAEACNWPEQMPSTLYRGYPVLELRPDESSDLTSSLYRMQDELDNGFALPLLSDLSGRALPMIGYRWFGAGRAERAAWRSLIYALRGQQRALWVSTFADDLSLLAGVAPTSRTLDVANCGYSRFGQSKLGRRDIRIELTDGSIFHRRITGSTELDSQTERLMIDAAFGRQLEPEQVSRISWLCLCRCASDTLEIEHITDSEGPATTSLTFQGVRDEL